MDYRYTLHPDPIEATDADWVGFESGYTPRVENLLSLTETAAYEAASDNFDLPWPQVITVEFNGAILGTAEVSMSLEPVFVSRVRETV